MFIVLAHKYYKDLIFGATKEFSLGHPVQGLVPGIRHHMHHRCSFPQGRVSVVFPVAL